MSDRAGKLYITDWEMKSIRKVSATGVEGSGGDGGPALQAGLSFPMDVTVDSDRALYFADARTRVQKISTGVKITTIAEGFEVPTGLTLDSAGTLYFSQAALYRIWKVAPGGKTGGVDSAPIPVTIGGPPV